MLPKTHAILGLVFSVILFLLVPDVSLVDASLVFLASVFVDADHYIYYVLRKKDISLRNAYAWFIEKRDFLCSLNSEEIRKYERAIMIFHGIEFWAILAFLIFIHKIFLFILAGILFHICLDLIDLLKRDMPLHGKLSQIYTHKTNKNRKKLE